MESRPTLRLDFEMIRSTAPPIDTPRYGFGMSKSPEVSLQTTPTLSGAKIPRSFRPEEPLPDAKRRR